MNKANTNNNSSIDTTGCHGFDIASSRLDFLDHQSMAYALNLTSNMSNNKNSNHRALDLGCGWGSQGLCFANMGLDMLLIDKLPLKQTIQTIQKCQPWLNINVVEKDIEQLKQKDLTNNLSKKDSEQTQQFSLVYSQRFIHYLPWSIAINILKLIKNNTLPQSRLYISASGINSELGNNYLDKNLPVEKRFSKLSKINQNKHNIKEKVCLYSEQDMNMLGEQVGLKFIQIFSSDFGNIKAIFEVPD